MASYYNSTLPYLLDVKCLVDDSSRYHIILGPVSENEVEISRSKSRIMCIK